MSKKPKPHPFDPPGTVVTKMIQDVWVEGFIPPENGQQGPMLVTCTGHGFSSDLQVYFNSLAFDQESMVGNLFYIEVVNADHFRVPSVTWHDITAHPNVGSCSQNQGGIGL